MKTITIKMPEEEVKELEEFIRLKNYASKSEFIRNLIMDRMDKAKKEKIGWMIIAQRSMNKIWDNKKDEKIWSKYL